MSDTSIEVRPDAEVVRSMRRFSRWSGVAVASIGVVVLAGWALDSDLARSFLPGQVCAKPNTGLALVLAGLAQALGVKPPRPFLRRLRGALAAVVGGLGLLTLLEYATGADLGIDRVLFPEPGGTVGTTFPGRMAALTALELVLYAATVTLRSWQNRRWEILAQQTALAGAVAAALATLGYTFNAHSLYALGGGTSIALPTSLALMLLFSGTLCAQPGAGWMSVVAGERAGGVLLRRLLPAAIAGPWFLGWVALAGSTAGFYGTDADNVLAVLSVTLLLSGLLYASARALDRLDMEREARKREVEALNRELESRVHKRTEELLALNDQLQTASRYARSLLEASLDPLVTISKDGKIMDVNQATEAVTGVSRAELIGSDFSDYFTEPDKARQGYRQVFADGAVRDYPLAIQHQDGRVTDVLYNATVFRNQGGEIEGVFAAARDVTERRQAEQALQHSEERYRSLVVATAQIVWTTNAEGEVDGDMPMWRAFTGQSQEELQGWGWIESLHPEDRPATSEVWSHAVENRVLYETEYRMRRNDGVYRHMAVRGVPVLNPDGGVREWTGTCTDISERKQAEQELRRLNRALKALGRCGEAIVRATDEVALLQKVCDIIVQVAGYPLAWVGYAEDDRDKSVTPVAVGGFGAAYVRNARITWDDSERGRGPTGTALRTGQPCYVGDIIEDPRFTPWRENAVRHGYASSLAVPLKDGGRTFGALNLYAPEPNAFDAEEQKLMWELADSVSHGILALRMRAERDEAARDLRQLNDTLEGKVAERTAQLTASTQEMESFTYSVSHDLRAPLRHIDGFSKVLLEQYGPVLDESGRHYLERVRHGTQSMGRLVDDLLNLSRIGRTSLRLENVDLASVVRELIEGLRPEAGERAIEWRVTALPVVACDANLIRQVIFNLLANAMKFTRGRSPAIIEVGSNGTEVFVRDNGVGFDPQYADKLFGVFQRLHRSEEFEGTGVGLATVKRIVQMHGGEVRAEASPDRGATFYVTLGQPEGSGRPALEVCHAA